MNSIVTSRGRKFRLIRNGLVILVIIAAGYVGISTWLANSRPKPQLGQQPQTNSKPMTNPDVEGSDKSALPPDTIKNYKVAADLPRVLYIDKLKITARILPMGVNTDGNIQAPVNTNDSGWYTGSVKPGEPGAMFIDGHASGASREGLFGSLDTLVIGDTLQVEKGDGSRLKYRVVHTETIDLANVDMRQALQVYGGAARGLNLMTCSGTWISGGKTLSKRVLVFTQQVS